MAPWANQIGRQKRAPEGGYPMPLSVRLRTISLIQYRTRSSAGRTE
jgi:hypothetical protein